jgi:hypothetical protein
MGTGKLCLAPSKHKAELEQDFAAQMNKQLARSKV